MKPRSGKSVDEIKFNNYFLDADDLLKLIESNQVDLDNNEMIKRMNEIIRHMLVIQEKAPDYKKNFRFSCTVKAYWQRAQSFFALGFLEEALADLVVLRKLMPK